MSRRFLTIVALSVLITGCSDATGNVPDSFLGCDRVEGYRLGDSEGGNLSTSDCGLSGSYIDYYAFTLSSDRDIVIDLASNQFDAYLILFDRRTGQVIEENDDGPFDTDARIAGFLERGDYVIGVTSFDPGEIGQYTLDSDTN